MSQYYTNVFQRGNRLFVRGYNDGTKYQEIIKFKPTLYVGTKADNPSGWKAFSTNQYVEPKEFDCIKDAKLFVETYKDVKGFDVYGQTNFVSQYIGTKWTREVPFDEKRIDSMVIDIETTTEFGFPDIRNPIEEVQLISCKRKGQKTITFAYKPDDSGKFLNCEYRRSYDEKSMLTAFVVWFKKNPPDVVTGWNIESFDIPYLCRRIEFLHGEEMVQQLSPFGFVNVDNVTVMDREELRYDICGVAILDYMAMYKKFTFKARESYKLDFICEVELGKKKLDHSEHKDFKSFYTNDWHKFIEYNIVDVELVEQLNDKLNILELIYGVSYLAKINYDECFSPIRTWESFIFNYLQKDRIAIPIKTNRNVRETFAGGHVKPTIKGSYDWVVTFDLTSMYPHNIMLNNISPETITGESVTVSVADLVAKKFDTSSLKGMNYTMTGNGQLFRRDIKGLFPIMMKDLFTVRKNANGAMKEMKRSGGAKDEISRLNTKQGAIKVLLNCLFGACGNPYFRYYDLRMAEGITLTGQVVIQWMERKMNEKLNAILKTNADYVIASDTDSLMINFGPFVKATCEGKSVDEIVTFLEKIGNTIFAEYIASCLNELAEYLNAVEPSLHMKLENICDRGIFVGSKNYILNVHSSEGVRYKTPDLKVMGIALVKSSTPAIMRTALRDSIPILLYKTEADIQEYLKIEKEKFFSMPVESIAFPRSVNDINKWQSSSQLYVSRTPIQVRAAIMYNHMLDKLGLANKYPYIKNGDKVKFAYLKVPNTIQEDVIGFIDELPKEFGLHRYVDYETQFEKAFVGNLKAMVTPMKWELVKKASMAQWGI